METRLQKALTDKDRAQKDVKECLTKIAGLEQQIEELKRDKENLYQKIEELKATAGRHRDECNKYEKELAQLDRKSVV